MQDEVSAETPTRVRASSDNLVSGQRQDTATSDHKKIEKTRGIDNSCIAS